MGQIEEILSMAKDELELIDLYVENKGLGAGFRGAEKGGHGG